MSEGIDPQYEGPDEYEGTADIPDPRPVPCCTDTLGMPIPCQHRPVSRDEQERTAAAHARMRVDRPVSPSSELTALAELLDWVDLIDAPGTVLADLVQRSRIELDAARAAPQADEGLRCAKCGGTDIATRWDADLLACGWHDRDKRRGRESEFAAEHLHRNCRTCGWPWGDPVAAAPVPAGLDRAPTTYTEVERLDRPGNRADGVRALSQLPEDAP